MDKNRVEAKWPLCGRFTNGIELTVGWLVLQTQRVQRLSTKADLIKEQKLVVRNTPSIWSCNTFCHFGRSEVLGSSFSCALGRQIIRVLTGGKAPHLTGTCDPLQIL